jgi:hypothetical protein
MEGGRDGGREGGRDGGRVGELEEGGREGSGMRLGTRVGTQRRTQRVRCASAGRVGASHMLAHIPRRTQRVIEKILCSSRCPRRLALYR